MWTRAQQWTKCGIKSGIDLPRAPGIWSISETHRTDCHLARLGSAG